MHIFKVLIGKTCRHRFPFPIERKGSALTIAKVTGQLVLIMPLLSKIGIEPFIDLVGYDNIRVWCKTVDLSVAV